MAITLTPYLCRFPISQANNSDDLGRMQEKGERNMMNQCSNACFLPIYLGAYAEVCGEGGVHAGGDDDMHLATAQ